MMPHPQTLWKMGGMGLGGGVNTFGSMCFEDDATPAHAFGQSCAHAHA